MIPLAKDTREAVGVFADKVENRGLLFEKMVLAKNWGHDVDRFNDANRFNVLRACSSGGNLLGEDRDEASRKAKSQHAKPHVKEQAAYRAKVAGALATVSVDDPVRSRTQVENTRNFLSLVEKAYGGRSHTFVAQLAGRLIINMAGGVQENAGMALDRCFGLPFIPGSAVKGVARHAALWDIRNTSDREEKSRKLRLALLAFGFIGQDIGRKGDFTWAANGDEAFVREAGEPYSRHESFKGMLSFLPAHPARELEIVAEVLTPHPRASVASQGKGDPRPIFFPSVEKGSLFGFAVLVTWMPPDAPAEDVLQQAGEWLRKAATVEGVGAKTGAGYGWFIIDPKAEEERREQMKAASEREANEKVKADADRAAIKKEIVRVELLSPQQRAVEKITKLDQQAFAEYAKLLTEKSEPEQRAFLEVLASPTHKDRRRRWKRRKPEIWAAIEPVANNLKITLP